MVDLWDRYVLADALGQGLDPFLKRAPSVPLDCAKNGLHYDVFWPIFGSVPASSRSMLLRWRQSTIRLATNDTTT